jgi:2-haloacid dehalogenase
MDRVIVFDVNETLLDVGALDPLFVRLFGDAAVRREWFGQMLQSAFVSTITETYRDFSTIGLGALVSYRRTRTCEKQWNASVRRGFAWLRSPTPR